MTNQQPTNISYWERTGKIPRFEVLVDMAKVLGVSVEQLLGQPTPRKSTALGGKLGQTFEAVSKLPRSQQSKILEVVDAFVAQHQGKHS